MIIKILDLCHNHHSRVFSVNEDNFTTAIQNMHVPYYAISTFIIISDLIHIKI